MVKAQICLFHIPSETAKITNIFLFLSELEKSKPHKINNNHILMNFSPGYSFTAFASCPSIFLYKDDRGFE
ncbi:MAG: hypothetical protein ACTHJ7_05460 [Candidatus Nitrosocosmicus sp.]